MNQEIAAVAGIVGMLAAISTALHTRYTSAYLRAGATTPARARKLEELKLRESPIRRRLTRKGVLVPAGEGFYVDEPVLDRRRSRSRLVGLTVLGLTLIALSAVFLVT